MQKLFGISITLNRDTPNLEAMVRVGEYFANGGSGDLAGSTDPIVLSCQKNWHMLFTDGITNQPKVPTKDVQNQDKTVPALPETVISIPALIPGQPGRRSTSKARQPQPTTRRPTTRPTTG